MGTKLSCGAPECPHMTISNTTNFFRLFFFYTDFTQVEELLCILYVNVNILLPWDTTKPAPWSINWTVEWTRDDHYRLNLDMLANVAVEADRDRAGSITRQWK